MKSTTVILATVLSALLVAGCASTKTEVRRTYFPFQHNEKQYEIISVSGSGTDGYNSILYRENGQVIFNARDADQDGRVDTILQGEVSLEDANAIYLAGLGQAKAQGNVKSERLSRLFDLVRPGGSYSVHSYLMGPGNWHNKFVAMDSGSDGKCIVQDIDADGVLDRADSEDVNMEHMQRAYQMVLQEGIRLGKIDFAEDRYIVRLDK